MFFDLNVKGNSYDNNLKLAMEASKYGWNHINFLIIKINLWELWSLKRICRIIWILM